MVTRPDNLPYVVDAGHQVESPTRSVREDRIQVDPPSSGIVNAGQKPCLSSGIANNDAGVIDSKGRA